MAKKIFIFLIIILIGLIAGQEVRAGVSDNVYGWAWAGAPEIEGGVLKTGLGWISFNNTTGGGAINYGVHICTSDTDPNPKCAGVASPKQGKFVGYTWAGGGQNADGSLAPTIGWIKFDPAGPYPTCPGTTCPAGSPNYSARVDLGTGKVTGWARAYRAIEPEGQTLGGWDGWILLGPIVKGGTDYGVYIDTTLSPAQFRNWAWGSDVVGWISFNCSNRGVCATSPYKVMTDLVISVPPSASTLNAETIYGCEVSPIVRFSWTYSGFNPQSAYEIQIDDDSNLDESPLVTLTPPNGGGDNSREYAGLSYGTQYWWRLKVWDSTNQESARIYPASSFDTGSRWPAPDFTWDPEAPSVGQDVTFDNQTQYCGAGGCTYSWDFDDGNSSTDFEPIHAFLTERSYNVILTATSAGHSCSCPHDVNVGAVLPIPIWKEIPPTF